MSRLLLEIAVAWFSLSLLCSFLWVLLLELVRRRAREDPTPSGKSTPTLSEGEVDALLSAPHSCKRVRRAGSRPERRRARAQQR
jgi:hypothetical protein